jgi:beta-glucanase (GH16 family)
MFSNLHSLQQPNHGMNFMSGESIYRAGPPDIHPTSYAGMIQSWNKFCFTGGYIEAAVSLPGSPDAPGFWPGVWTMVGLEYFAHNGS